MADGRPSAEGKPRRPSLARNPLVWIAVIALAPIVASYTVYYFFPRTATANYGTLLPVAPIAGVEGTRLDGAPFRLDELRGRWVLVAFGSGGCDAGCERRLYATRQARAIQGKEQDRIARVLLLADGADPSSALLSQHPGLVVARDAGKGAAEFPGNGKGLYLVDPLGNLVLSWPDDPDIKGIAKDLTRVLKASRIG